MSNHILDGDTPASKGVRTFFQTATATFLAFLYGLYQLPGVSDYTQDFIRTEGLSLFITLIVAIGVPSGIIAYLQNKKGM